MVKETANGLTGDPPEMAKRASRYLASEQHLLLADLIVAETVYSFDQAVDRVDTVERVEPPPL